MIKRSMVIGLLSAGVVAVPGMALASAQVNSTPIIPVSTPATVSTTAAQADQAALAAVGGGTVTSTSTDTYQGASVYDIHVLFNSVVYDVKVLQSNDSVVLKKVSSSLTHGLALRRIRLPSPYLLGLYRSDLNVRGDV